ncbi:hypothetical protein HBB16_10755 [Pseudonocardia sp. MCCB 268]|nr:hypothetical protein [Pseudonocardia cytotoxica]
MRITYFEMAVHADWKRRIVEADALDAVKVANDDLIMPPYTRPGTAHRPRALRTPLVDARRPPRDRGRGGGRAGSSEPSPAAAATSTCRSPARPSGSCDVRPRRDHPRGDGGCGSRAAGGGRLTAPPAREHQPAAGRRRDGSRRPADGPVRSRPPPGRTFLVHAEHVARSYSSFTATSRRYLSAPKVRRTRSSSTWEKKLSAIPAAVHGRRAAVSSTHRRGRSSPRSDP